MAIKLYVIDFSFFYCIKNVSGSQMAWGYFVSYRVLVFVPKQDQNDSKLRTKNIDCCSSMQKHSLLVA